MSTDLLDDSFVKVTRVSHKATSEVVCVLETVEDIIKHWRLRPLLQLRLGLLSVEVEVLDPVVMLGGQVCGDVLLELDHVAVGDLLCVGGGHDGSCIAVDGGLVQHGRGRGQQRQRQADEVLHDCGGGECSDHQ